MTDNERKAHDLAVAISVDICRDNRETRRHNGKKEFAVNYFEEYLNTYKDALELLNSEFPNGK